MTDSIAPRATWFWVIRQVVVLGLIACCIVTAGAQSVPVAKGFEAFRGLRTRNIFDPDRRGPRLESAPATASAPRSSFLQLTGTMVSGGRALAFFSGSSSDYNKVLRVREKVGDYTVTSINPAHVDLEHAGGTLTLPVGKQIALDGSGTVSVAQPIAPSESSSATSSSIAPPAGVPADKAEVLRRMMERRQQEVSK